MSEIIPANPNSQIGRLLVSTSIISKQYIYKKVIMRHLKEDIIDWFIDNNTYKISQIILGVKSEIEYIHSNRYLFSHSYHSYTDVLYILLELLGTLYTPIDYPECYI